MNEDSTMQHKTAFEVSLVQLSNPGTLDVKLLGKQDSHSNNLTFKLANYFIFELFRVSLRLIIESYWRIDILFLAESTRP